VLIVMLIGFTVMQHAFAGGVTTGIVSDVERRALALTGAGDLIWDWDVAADKSSMRRPRSMQCSTSGAAASCWISGCARRTGITCGSP
jgi:hypothetical protein